MIYTYITNRPPVHIYQHITPTKKHNAKEEGNESVTKSGGGNFTGQEITENWALKYKSNKNNDNNNYNSHQKNISEDHSRVNFDDAQDAGNETQHNICSTNTMNFHDGDIINLIRENNHTNNIDVNRGTNESNTYSLVVHDMPDFAQQTNLAHGADLTKKHNIPNDVTTDKSQNKERLNGIDNITKNDITIKIEKVGARGGREKNDERSDQEFINQQIHYNNCRNALILNASNKNS